METLLSIVFYMGLFLFGLGTSAVVRDLVSADSALRKWWRDPFDGTAPIHHITPLSIKIPPPPDPTPSAHPPSTTMLYKIQPGDTSYGQLIEGGKETMHSVRLMQDKIDEMNTILASTLSPSRKVSDRIIENEDYSISRK
jgi:hypothetical protein